MNILNELISFFGIDSLSETATFIDFVPWFSKCLLAVFLISFIVRCFFTATWKIGRELK